MQKKLIQILLLICLFSLTFACQTESYDFIHEDGSIEILQDGRLCVPILLYLPEREVVETKSIPNDTEKAIKSVDVCVFDANGNVVEKVKGEIDPANSLRVFAKVLARKDPSKIQIYANIPAGCRAAFNKATIQAEIDALIMSKIIFEKDSVIKNGLPLVSALDSYPALNSVTLTGKVANLKFAYACIDITNNTTDFKLTSFKGLNLRQNSYLIEKELIASPDGIFQSTERTQLTGIYLFESPGSTPTDLLIKGSKTGFGEGYYKIRIAYGTNKATCDIRRGVRYVVNITNVKGPGYITADEAIANEPANIEYDITVDDGSSKDVIISNGKYYLGVSNSEFIVFADDAYGVTATTLSHNAPKDKVKTAIIQVTGTGITLVANQQGLAVSSDGKSAMIDLQTTKMPIKVDLPKDVLQTGTLTIRIGDLVKTIAIKKLAKVSDDGKTISLSDLGLTNSSITTMNSLSPRITVSQNKSLVVAKAADTKFDAYSYAEAFSTGQQGSIRIAVQQTIQNIVYYEQYTDDSYGFYFIDQTSTLRGDKLIKDTGYGVLGTRGDITQIKLGVNGQSFTPTNSLLTGFSDYTMSFYPMSHRFIVPLSQINAVGVLINDAQTTANYIYPNFAKAISTSSTINIGTQGYQPHSIRTPKQFCNINAVAANSSSRYFKQERDLDFSNTNIGGATSFTASIISNSFKGNYDGAGKAVSNLTLNSSNQSMALFLSNIGTIKDMRLYNINVTGGSNSSCLVGENKGTIETILIDGLRITASGQYVGAIAGANSAAGSINNCFVMAVGDEAGSGKNTIYSSNTKPYVGGIAGINRSTSNGIKNVCVLDKRIVPKRSFVSSADPANTTAGIVGHNQKMLENAVYLAMPPSGNVDRVLCQFPICRYMNEASSSTKNNHYLRMYSHYLRGENTGTERFTTRNYVIGSTPYIAFSQCSIADLQLDPTYWEKITGYPYPKLKLLPVPTTENYPVVDQLN